MKNVNYNYDDMTNADLAMWADAKFTQLGIVFEQPVTAETNTRLDELITEAHKMMFFDAIALGGRK